MSAAEWVETVLADMAMLRSRCPWSAGQTHESLAPYAVEEAQELAEAVAKLDGSAAAEADVISELGDVLYQVVFHAALLDEARAAEPGASLGLVAQALHEKLHRRHPYVFASDDWRDITLAEVARVYQQMKDEER